MGQPQEEVWMSLYLLLKYIKMENKWIRSACLQIDNDWHKRIARNISFSHVLTFFLYESLQNTVLWSHLRQFILIQNFENSFLSLKLFTGIIMSHLLKYELRLKNFFCCSVVSNINGQWKGSFRPLDLNSSIKKSWNF